MHIHCVGLRRSVQGNTPNYVVSYQLLPRYDSNVHYPVSKTGVLPLDHRAMTILNWYSFIDLLTAFKGAYAVTVSTNYIALTYFFLYLGETRTIHHTTYAVFLVSAYMVKLKRCVMCSITAVGATKQGLHPAYKTSVSYTIFRIVEYFPISHVISYLPIGGSGVALP